MAVERPRDALKANPIGTILPGTIFSIDLIIAVILWMFRVEILGEEQAHLMAYASGALVVGGIVSFFVLKKTLNKITQ